jgi:uncharacterized protein YjbI with pentapeptide repeats
MAEEPEQENRDAPSNGDKPSRGLLIGFAIAGAILLVAFLWVWVNPSDPTEKKDFIQAVGVLLAALAGLGGLYFTAQNLKQTRQDTEKQLQQARGSTEDQLQLARESQAQNQMLTEQGQITERFTRAVEQLGATDDRTSNPRLELRLGGIYALERIAWDSPKRDYTTVVQVLTAYVRMNTPQAPGPSEGTSTPASPSNEATAGADEGAKQPDAPSEEPRRPTADIQAVLDVLGRLQLHVSEEYRTRLDLRGANLEGANLQDAYLRGANLQEANLQEANLEGANLQWANLFNANLQRAYLGEAKLHGANLEVAYLQRANLQGAYLQWANLRAANLYYAKLQHASLVGANLHRADLLYARLQNAYLRDANLEDAYLDDANLQDASLLPAGVGDAQLAATRSLEGATMPDGQILRGYKTPNGPTFWDWLKGKEDEKNEESPGLEGP